MVFSSLVFIFVYLPAVLLIYYISPAKWRNVFLFLVNMIFYGWGEPVYLLLMIASICVDYLLGIGIEKYRENGRVTKGLVTTSVVWNIGLLFFFKYFDFLLQSLQSVGLFENVPLLGFTLPIGISFYTFQKLSYTIDVYRGVCKGQKNFIDFSVFVTLFPQLIAGPILQYKDLAEQLKSRILSIGKMRDGIRIFTVGLCKKVLLANSIGKLWDSYRILEASELSVMGAWLGLLAFCFQIYFDFSGYSDMAIGLGKMLGFDFNINFDYPYISRSITEFWRRWHISLSSWFRDYLYIPLGGNRKGKTRWMLNIFLVWAATGIWHGASFNFLLWGVYYAVLLMIEKLWLLKKLEKAPAAIRHLYALFFIALGWGIFAIPDAAAKIGYLGALFGTSGIVAEAGDIFWLVNYAVMFVVLGIASTPLCKGVFEKLPDKAKSIAETILIMSGLLLSTAYLVDSTYNPFLYFRF